MAKTVAQKLLIRTGQTVLAIAAPRGFSDVLGELPTGAKLTKKSAKAVDQILVFAATIGEMDKNLAIAKPLLVDGGLLWACYPKSGQLNTDLKRDIVADCAQRAGMHPVSQIAIDDVWSALRMKPDA